jgi:hypothetical protein
MLDFPKEGERMREEKKRGVCGKKEKSEFCSLL